MWTSIKSASMVVRRLIIQLQSQIAEQSQQSSKRPETKKGGGGGWLGEDGEN